MSSPASPVSPPIADPAPPASPGEIDLSCRWPVGLLLFCASGWLLFGGVVGALAAIKLHAPGLLAHWPMFTYGRIQPVAWNAFVLGFGLQAGLGIALWIMARLSGATLVGTGSIILGTLTWNAGLKLGLLSVLMAGGTGMETLELPRFAVIILFVGYALIAAWPLVVFQRRRRGDVYPSEWFFVAALFSFPWLYLAGNCLAVWYPLRGVLQAAAQAWFTHGLFIGWFGFLTIGVALYLLPKISGVALPSRNLAGFGFWLLAVFGFWGGAQRYFAGPLPAYLTAQGVVATVLTVFPMIAIGLLVWPVVQTSRKAIFSVPAGRFAVAGLGCFLAWGGLAAINCLSPVRAITQFTLATVALDHLLLWGAFGLTAIGACYYIAPQVIGRELPFAGWISWHFRLATAAVLLHVVAFGVGGLIQGAGLENPDKAFIEVMRGWIPFAGMGTLAMTLQAVGGLLLFANVVAAVVAQARAAVVPVAQEWLTPSAPKAEVRP
ncbi:MAG: cbb3-type cytochrome c oxidase subunit I [Verrucomicrobia bacterium]|nr:cbb3-type cytochrome c oxidase subunit I [Verrucomicrobiota bacterium]